MNTLRLLKTFIICLSTATALVYSSWVLAAPTCQKTGSVCVEGPETRNINGAQVTKDCWRYQDQYQCVAQDAVDNCAPLRTNAACVQTNTTCTSTAFNGDCLNYKNTYSCSSAVNSSSIVTLPMQYTITKDALNDTCTNFSANPQCQKTGSVCLDGPSTHTINGLDVTKDCWNRTDTYACVSLQDNCQSLKSNSSCKLTNQTCDSGNPDGSCSLSTFTYTCATGTTPSQEVTQCSGSTLCINGLCFDDANSGKDTDFGKAIALMEAGREAAGYAQNAGDLKFFVGEDNRCGSNPLNSCCKSNPGGAAMSNGAMVSGAIHGAVNATGAVVKQTWGSWYVFDAMSTRNTNIVEGLFSKFSPDSVSWIKYDLSKTSFFSYYGVSFQPFAGAGQMFSFDPTSMAIQIGMQVVMQLMSCSQSEQMLAMKRGQNLCHYVGSYCNNKVLGVCLSHKQSHCCYNSPFARMIQEQGRAQLGQGWGSAEAPQCGGFSQTDFDRLDFSQMDWSELISEVMANVQLPDTGQTNAEIQKTVTDKIQNYYTTH